jgi:hypothetical protein
MFQYWALSLPVAWFMFHLDNVISKNDVTNEVFLFVVLPLLNATYWQALTMYAALFISQFFVLNCIITY